MQEAGGSRRAPYVYSLGVSREWGIMIPVESLFPYQPPVSLLWTESICKNGGSGDPETGCRANRPALIGSLMRYAERSHSISMKRQQPLRGTLSATPSTIASSSLVALQKRGRTHRILPRGPENHRMAILWLMLPMSNVAC